MWGGKLAIKRLPHDLIVSAVIISHQRCGKLVGTTDNPIQIDWARFSGRQKYILKYPQLMLTESDVGAPFAAFYMGMSHVVNGN